MLPRVQIGQLLSAARPRSLVDCFSSAILLADKNLKKAKNPPKVANTRGSQHGFSALQLSRSTIETALVQSEDIGESATRQE
jgi:hypothetical protein